MVSVAATSLRDALQQKMRELGEKLEGITEEDAARSPAGGEWTCNEMLSHLMGDEGAGFVAGLRRFVEEDRPLIEVTPGQLHLTPARQAMSLSELRAGVWRQYEEVADFIGGLSDEQLARKGRVPLLKETPIGEQPTLGQWAGAIISFHLSDHIGQMGKVREALGK
jgi:hypothetical protein